MLCGLNNLQSIIFSFCRNIGNHVGWFLEESEKYGIMFGEQVIFISIVFSRLSKCDFNKGVKSKILNPKFNKIEADISLKTKAFLVLCIETVPFSMSHSSIGNGMKEQEII